LNINPNRKVAINLVAVLLGLLAFALVGGGVGLYALSKVGAADRHLYSIGINNLETVSKLKEVFTWCPSNMRDIIIETEPTSIERYVAGFRRTKKATQDTCERLGPLVMGNAKNERLYGEVVANFEKYWVAVEDVLKLAVENKNREAIYDMRNVAYPQLMTTGSSITALQDKMKNDAEEQFLANKRVVFWASVAMAVCTAAIAMLSGFFAVLIAKLM
jgi:hypothetical protein